MSDGRWLGAVFLAAAAGLSDCEGCRKPEPGPSPCLPANSVPVGRPFKGPAFLDGGTHKAIGPKVFVYDTGLRRVAVWRDWDRWRLADADSLLVLSGAANPPQDGARKLWPAGFEATRVGEDTFRLRKRARDGGKTALELAADVLGPLAGLGVVEPDFLAEIVPVERSVPTVACEARAEPSRSEAVKVAILDTGFPLHDCLPDWQVGFDALDGRGEISRDVAGPDENGHGTFCAGLIAAHCPVLPSGGSFFGANPKVDLLPARVADANGCANVSDIARGLAWARTKGAEIASISLVSESRSRVLEREIRRSRMLVVAAVGNFDGRNLDRLPYYPAATPAPNLLAVGGFGCIKRIGSFGHMVDVLAPGENVLSLKGRDRFEDRSGTSVATAITAGRASLLEAAAHRAGRHLAPRDLRLLLLTSSRRSTLPEPQTAPSSCSRGILDLDNALEVLGGRGKARNVLDCLLTKPF
jgi:hypothetical protein